MRVPVRMLVAAALAGGAVTVPTSAAHALSCVDPPTVLHDATDVYAGTVEQVEDERFLFAVEEVWAGGPVGRRVWLSTPADMAVWYPWADEHAQPHEPGSPQQWVVALDQAGTVGPCSLWLSDAVAAHRPDTVTEPTPDAEPHPGGAQAASAELAPVAVSGAVGVAVAAVVGGLWRHRAAGRRLRRRGPW